MGREAISLENGEVVRQPLTKHLDGGVADTDIPHHDLPEAHALEVGHVRAHGGLLVRPAVDIVEQLTGKPPPGQLPVVEHGRRGEAEGAVGREARHGA